MAQLLSGKVLQKSKIHHCRTEKNDNMKDEKLMNSSAVHIVTSGLNRKELVNVQEFCRSLHFQISNEITDKTTHLVVKKNKDGKCSRTYKYMLALLTKLWIVSIEWIDLCYEVGGIFPEEYFEIIGDNTSQGNYSIARKARKNDKLLLKDYNLCYCNNSQNFLSYGQVRQLIILSGAKFVEKPADFKENDMVNNCFILIHVLSKSKAQNLYKQHHVSVVDIEWFLSSITSVQIRSVGKYFLNSFF